MKRLPEQFALCAYLVKKIGANTKPVTANMADSSWLRKCVRWLCWFLIWEESPIWTLPDTQVSCALLTVTRCAVLCHCHHGDGRVLPGCDAACISPTTLCSLWGCNLSLLQSRAITLVNWSLRRVLIKPHPLPEEMCMSFKYSSQERVWRQ